MAAQGWQDRLTKGLDVSDGVQNHVDHGREVDGLHFQALIGRGLLGGVPGLRSQVLQVADALLDFMGHEIVAHVGGSSSLGFITTKNQPTKAPDGGRLGWRLCHAAQAADSIDGGDAVGIDVMCAFQGIQLLVMRVQLGRPEQPVIFAIRVFSQRLHEVRAGVRDAVLWELGFGRLLGHYLLPFVITHNVDLIMAQWGGRCRPTGVE